VTDDATDPEAGAAAGDRDPAVDAGDPEPYDIERYLNVRSAYGAGFSPDGTLSFLLNTTGTPQVWTLEDAGEWPHQHTFYEERITFASWSPERRELVFGMDEGGNEREQLFRLDPDRGRIRPLTRHPDAKHWWGGWAPDGDRFAFASNRRDESVFDVYVQDRDAVGANAQLVYEGDGWYSVGGWDPAGERLLVSEAHSSFDQDVYVLDVETGELSHLTPHEGDVRHTSAEWGPNGEYVYLVTDREVDTLKLVAIEVETGAIETVADGGEWNVDGVAVDRDTGRLVYSRNVEGYTELTVGELDGPTTIERFPSPDLPKGTAGGVAFSDGADRFALSATGAADNTNVYVVETETGETERWTDAETAGIPRETFVPPDLVHVESFDGLEVPGFFSLPRGIAPGERSALPVVVDVHGGPESQRRPSFSPVKQYLLSNGYAVFEPNVRGSSGYGKAYAALDDVRKRMDSVRDLKACADWLRERPEVDGDRIAVMGGSYGGFMVLAALTEYPELWAAGVDVVGIANFVTFLENTGDWRRELREAEYGSLAADREFLEEISPINNVEQIAAPLFVLHGENDPRVPVDEAEQIVERAREQGVPVRKLLFEDEGHGFSKLENRIEAYTQIVDFLDNYVR
jgi:dipeptidyl aminopeptidase/acylaminoacyl peptidase